MRTCNPSGRGQDPWRASIDDEMEHFVLYLYELTPFEALNKAGILFDDFWLEP
jgi:hypothetical protein